MKQKYDVSGMSCAACSARVERAISALDGIGEVNVNLLTKSMTVDYDDNMIDDDGIIQAVEKAGYGAAISDIFKKSHESDNSDGNTENDDILFEEEVSMRKRLIYSLVLFVPLFYISMGHMVGLPLPGFLTGTQHLLPYALIQLVLTAFITVINRKYFISGYKGVVNKAPNMDTLVSVGAAASILYSLYITVIIAAATAVGDNEVLASSHHELYFESAGTILTLITVGKYMEARSKGKTTDAISRLLDLSPEMATVLINTETGLEEIEVDVSVVSVGDIVVVKPGQRIPVDGIVVQGTAAIDRSMLTGESLPKDVVHGDFVECGTINISGNIRIKTEKIGEDTALANIIKLVDEAGGSKAPIAKLADKVSGVFVPIVMSIAALTGIIWLISGAEGGFALSMAISVLVISCPCALGLATPVAIMVGTGKAAENGILFKSGEYLEKAHEIDTVFFDKTGTVTEGKPRAVSGGVVPGMTKMELYTIAASIEKLSEHPIAGAIVRIAETRGIRLLDVDKFEVKAGKGIAAKIGRDSYLVGNITLMNENNIDCSSAVVILDKFQTDAITPVLVAKNEELVGLLGVSDNVRPTSAETISRLNDMEIKTIMLTGDNRATAEAFARQLNISEVIPEVLPENKEEEVRRVLADGHVVAMVGDGINDAPALVRADIGIAIGTGTDVAIESADIVLMKDDPLDIVTAIKLSKSVIKNVKMNLFWAFIYNVIGIPIAAGVFYPLFGLKLNPMIAAAAMSLSSFCVVMNALRLRSFTADKAD